jgi:hypothetical protein
MQTSRTSVIYLIASMAIILSYGCGGCSQNNNQTPRICLDASLLKMPPNYNKEHKYTLIFLDYTDNRIMGENAQKAVMKEIRNGLVSPHDRVDLYLITSNTATRTTDPIVSIELSIAYRQDLIPYANTDSINKSRIYACQWLQAIDSSEQVIKKAIEGYSNKTDTVGNGNSDIAGLFYIANREFSKYNSEIKKTLFIISDLEQNCPGFFALTGTCFSTESNIAVGNPDTDFKRITSGSVNVENFTGAAVKLLKGDMQETKSNNAVQNKVMIYWETLFARFGMKINSTIE